jgi:hypothetical protein
VWKDVVHNEQILDCVECKEMMLIKQKLDSTEKKYSTLNKQNVIFAG